MKDNGNEQHKSASHPGRRKSGGSIITMPIDQDVLTLEEAAAYFRCSSATLKRRAKILGIPYKRVGSLWRFSRKALEAWMEDQEKAD